MAAVELLIGPVPAHVRTARQVAVVLGRRAGLDPTALDEVRLAVGEACGLAVALEGGAWAAEGPVTVRFDDADGLLIEISAPVPLDAARGQDAVRVLAGAVDRSGAVDALPPAAALAVLAEVAPRCSVETGRGGPRIELAWPAG